MENWPAPVVAALAGCAGGVVLGLAARLARFCTLAAIEDAMFGRDLRRLRMWGLALAVALVGVAILSETGSVDFSQTLYHRLTLNPAAWIVGGVMFGLGMALCGTCGYGTLARVGGGDLRALFGFLVIGIASYMAIAGPTAQLRIWLLDPLSVGGAFAPRTLGQLVGNDAASRAVLALGVALILAAWSLRERAFRQSSKHIFWGLMVGLAIVSGWAATGWLGRDPFDPQPLVSFTFSVPLGKTIIYAMTMSSATLDFGIGSVFGVIAGAYWGAKMKREFRWEGAEDAREMRRHLVGAFLMGTGGVYAGGCTIGQGLSAASVLAISVPVVMLSIWCGVWIGLTYLMEGSLIGGLRGLFSRS